MYLLCLLILHKFDKEQGCLNLVLGLVVVVVVVVSRFGTRLPTYLLWDQNVVPNCKLGCSLMPFGIWSFFVPLGI